MTPLTFNPIALFVGAAAAIAIGFGAGWHVNGWRLAAEIERLQAQHEKGRADQAQAALDDLTAAAGNIKAAADGAHIDFAGLDKKLELIRRDFRDAKPSPLPADCRPDAVRVRKLSAAADAVDEAIAGLKLSRALQTDRSP